MKKLIKESTLRREIREALVDHKLHKTSVRFPSADIVVEIADTDFSRAKGLMFRDSLDEDKGMLFIFPDMNMRGFWMKNTLIPLSIAYANEMCEIINIEKMIPHDHRNTMSKGPAKYAIEANAGWFDKNGIQVGDKFEIA